MLFFTTAPTTQKFIPWFFYLLKEYWPMFLDGMKYTIIIALIGTILGLMLAMLITPLKILKVTKRDPLIIKILKKLSVYITTFYVEVLRGTPMMVQAMIIYYSLVGYFQLQIQVQGTIWVQGIIIYGILIVSINSSAYITEVLRGSVEAINMGQMEACRSLGMTSAQAMRHVIIPQALKNSIPPIGNEFVINIKDTSVLNVIGVMELYFAARKVNGIWYQAIPTFAIAAILYLSMTFITTRILYFVSKRLGNPKKKTSFPTSQNNPDFI